MTPPRTGIAKENLKKGIAKMRESISPGAAVRRDFQRTRPLKPDTRLPLHPEVVWTIAAESLADFRGRLTKAGQDARGTTASVVYVRSEHGVVRPHFLEIERVDTPEALMLKMVETLMQPGNVAIGMVFTHDDPTGGMGGKSATAVFPYGFTGLSPEAVNHLRTACTAQMAAIQGMQNQN